MLKYLCNLLLQHKTGYSTKSACCATCAYTVCSKMHVYMRSFKPQRSCTGKLQKSTPMRALSGEDFMSAQTLRLSCIVHAVCSFLFVGFIFPVSENKCQMCLDNVLHINLVWKIRSLNRHYF